MYTISQPAGLPRDFDAIQLELHGIAGFPSSRPEDSMLQHGGMAFLEYRTHGER